jgi:hypothetical protein
MDLLIAILYIFFFFGVPITFLAIAILCLVYGAKTSTVILRLLLAFLAYGLSTVIFAFGLAFILIGPDYQKPGDPDFWDRLPVGLGLSLVQGFIAWLLCSFVNGKLITSIGSIAPEPKKTEII